MATVKTNGGNSVLSCGVVCILIYYSNDTVRETYLSHALTLPTVCATSLAKYRNKSLHPVIYLVHELVTLDVLHVDSEAHLLILKQHHSWDSCHVRT
jgi:hypothetical protein